MAQAITHLKVPTRHQDRSECLGPDGSAAQVIRVLAMVSGRWKLPILFRLYEQPKLRNAELKRDMPNVSQKMLTQHLRELEEDGLISRLDFGEPRPRVEYSLTPGGLALIPVLAAAKRFSESHQSSRL
ncbi:helix-turn-helix transcriptional regulator [Mesorhizobium sp. BR1-1-16]|uniref:winged helix-turn-helix transcriptional regulator n=1 Tax=Mesorhizobium sp. BR1-1-16 TaxID=2876653 RepID=UPI001CCBC0CB|nr:helix-turn-helix domain-containing protein [Mesorhizobium sp. BR1-1-16]MBZ9937192.1 helix-turn-helix transcriptional regulator [Mesorhizobium sp. BR1-1-16]